ncbi:MAG: tyrosine-type recombinase/integrase [bacterium]|nr:tyrosine-type recombinase/integrase [bacterium]
MKQASQDFLAHCRLEKNLSAHTLKAYQGDLNSFIRFLGPKVSPEQVGKEQLRLFLGELKDGQQLKATSIKRRYACLKVFFAWLEEEERISLTPFHRFRLQLRLPHRLPRHLHRTELRQLFTLAAKAAGLDWRQGYPDVLSYRAQGAGTFGALSLLVGIELMYSTGIRVGELVEIGLEELDLEAKEILIHGKGQRERRVYLMDSELLQLLGLYLAQRSRLNPDHPKLLCDAAGQPLDTAWVRQRIKALNLDRHVTPHMLRHSCATGLIECGTDIRFVQRLLGHQSISTTQLYTHIQDQALRQALTLAQPRRQMMG